MISQCHSQCHSKWQFPCKKLAFSVISECHSTKCHSSRNTIAIYECHFKMHLIFECHSQLQLKWQNNANFQWHSKFHSNLHRINRRHPLVTPAPLWPPRLALLPNTATVSSMAGTPAMDETARESSWGVRARWCAEHPTRTPLPCLLLQARRRTPAATTGSSAPALARCPPLAPPCH